MGQCVSFNPMAPYASVRPYDAASLEGFSLPIPGYEDYCYGGQSDSKGARSKRGAGGGGSGGRGASMSFGFRGRKGGAKGASVAPEASKIPDKNGNGGSTEELFTGSPVMSGRSTPLARPRKEAAGQPLRTNRFGFRQTTIPKTAKVADVNISAEQALSANHREMETKNNNFMSDKPARPATVSFGLIPTQISPNGTANITSPPKPTHTKQTIILTYSAKQYPAATMYNQALRSKSPAIPNRVTPQHVPVNPRSMSASRAYTNSSGYDAGGYRSVNLNKYTMQTNQLPKPQYPSVKLLDSKSAKQVANNTRKGYGSSDGSSKEGSMTEDSGVGVDVDPPPEGGWSPRSSRREHRRPRTLEMVMRGEHSFHLRELQVSDLDIMDEAIVTDVDVIPLPKLPSTFGKDNRPNLASDYPPANRFSRLLSSIEDSTSGESQMSRSGLSTLERYRRDRRPESVLDKGEEKVSRDRLQRENVEKQDCMKVSTSSHSPLTRNSSKESSPSTKSDERSDPLEAWMNQTAGESMALRSNDEDISAALSLSSSCDEERGFNKTSNLPSFTQARVEIDHNEPRDYAKLSACPLMLKSLTLSQNSNIQSMIMSTSMSSSAFSGGSDSQQFTLLTEDPKAALAALASSNQSLIDDETSPADSLISSSSESNNDMPILEKDTTMSSSAYHTADNKNEENKEDEEKEVCEENNTKENGSSEKASPQNKSPHTPGTPSHSLSLSEGRDFLIDDEIADQPALMFEGNSTAEQMTSSLQLVHFNATDNSATLQDHVESPLVTKKNKGLQNSQKVYSSPLFTRRPMPRSPSLDTLSPCDSIASDDLICDMDLNHSLTSLNSQDDYIDRLDGSIRSGLNSLEDAQLREELMKYTISHKRQLTNALNSEMSLNGTPTHKHQGQSASTSNSSLANIGAALPVRTRLLSRSRAPTPEVRARAAAPPATGPPAPPDDGALRLERAAHGCMQQDIVAIKAMLNKLKKVLQEPDEGHNMMRTETLNPLDIQRDQSWYSLKNGPSLHLLGELGEASPPPPPPEPHEEVADLRRQLVFLQSQLEERERMVKLLQQQMSKISQDNSPNGDHSRCNGLPTNDDMCNVATQTERLRPLSQGQHLLQSLSSDTHTGGLVSWNEQWKPSKLSSPNDYHQPPPTGSSTPRLRKPLSSSISSPNNSDCEKSTSYTRSPSSTRSYPDSATITATPDNSILVKTNCRIGSRYLQAIASKQNGAKDSPSERSLRSRSLYSSRSKSIENFNNHNTLCNTNVNTENKTNGFKLVFNNPETPRLNIRIPLNESDARATKHHNSHSNIFNGHSNSIDHNECNYFKTDGNLLNGYGNGNHTDTDENSDSGYKSLPPVIGLSNNRVSGIPRKSPRNEMRYSSSKQAQTNKC